MSIRCACSGCNSTFAVAAGMAGRKVKCIRCGAVLRVPEAPAAAAAPEADLAALAAAAAPAASARPTPRTRTTVAASQPSSPARKKATAAGPPPPTPNASTRRPRRRWLRYAGAAAAFVALFAGIALIGSWREASHQRAAIDQFASEPDAPPRPLVEALVRDLSRLAFNAAAQANTRTKRQSIVAHLALSRDDYLAALQPRYRAALQDVQHHPLPPSIQALEGDWLRSESDSWHRALLLNGNGQWRLSSRATDPRDDPASVYAYHRGTWDAESGVLVLTQGNSADRSAVVALNDRYLVLDPADDVAALWRRADPDLAA